MALVAAKRQTSTCGGQQGVCLIIVGRAEFTQHS